MKTKFTKVMSLILAAMLLFVLAGCSKEDSGREDRDEDNGNEKFDISHIWNPDKDQDGETEPEASTEQEPVYEKQTVYLCVRATMEQWDESGTSEIAYTYDEYGNRVGEHAVTYGNYTECAYDFWGNMVEKTSYNSEGVVTSRCISTYNQDGQVLTEQYTYNGEPTSDYTYTYDQNGYLVEKVQFSHSSGKETRSTTTYNDDYSESRIDRYEDGVLKSYTQESFSEAGCILTTDTYAADGTWSSSVVYTYDSENRVSTEWHTSSHELQPDYEVIYTYDDNGLLVFKNVDYYYGYGMTYEYELFEIQVRVN